MTTRGPSPDTPRRRWPNLSPKRSLHGLILAFFLTALVAQSQANEKMVSLYFNALAREEVPEISLALTLAGIEHEIPVENQRVLLPKDRLVQAQAHLLRVGLPAQLGREHSHPKLKFLEGSETKHDFRQTEIQLENVLLETSLFRKGKVKLGFHEGGRVTARISLQTFDSNALTSSRYRALVNLVSLSVANLSPEDVVVVDEIGVWGGPWHDHSCFVPCHEPICSLSSNEVVE